MHPLLLTILLLIPFLPIMGQHIEDEDILQLHEMKFRWMEAVQIDSLDYYLHDDAVYVHSNAWREVKSEVLENIQSGKLTYRKVTVLDAILRRDGSTAVVNGRGLFEVALEGRSIDIYLDYTEVYVKASGRWQLYSRHACKYEPE